jgi:predicted carbohydrate-binding protein with CBM5 and CBM33 domain
MKYLGEKVQVVYSVHIITQYGNKFNEYDVAFISKNFVQTLKKEFSRLKSETCTWRVRTHIHRQIKRKQRNLMSLMSSSSKDSKQVARYQRKSPQNIKINA